MNSVLFLLIGVQLVTIPFDLGVSGLAFVFEAGSSWIGFRSFQKAKGERSWWQAIRQSKDPVGFTILLEMPPRSSASPSPRSARGARSRFRSRGWTVPTRS